MRNWLLPIHSGHRARAPFYPKWIANNVLSQGDSVVLLILDEEKEFFEKFFSGFKCHFEFASMREFGSVDFENIINKYDIDSFFCHASFASSIMNMRKTLLSEQYINRVLAIWHEGGFLRRANPSQSLCMQLDWMGWNAISSLANIKVSRLKELNKNQRSWLSSFMHLKFLSGKIDRKKKETTRESLREIANTTKPIIFVPLQVETDSVIVHFSDNQYHKMSFFFQELPRLFPDCFFVLRDHPKQISKASHLQIEKSGKNYLLLDDSFDTISLCLSSDVVITVNSTVGFESLYWKPVVCLGKSAYKHPEISFNLEDLDRIVSDNKKKKKKNIDKFLYYAIRKFHYTIGENARSVQDWCDNLGIFKRRYIKNKLGKIV